MESQQRIYPIGVQNFEKIRKDGYVYIDKTALIYQLVSSGSYYFLSRPRRFGKSLLISTLEAYFQGKRELFEGLAMEKLEKNWVKRPVLHLDLNIGKYDTPDSLDKILDNAISQWEAIYGTGIAEATLALRFKGILERAYKQTGERVAILIDEYDVPLENAYLHGFYDKMIGFIRSLFESALKTNPYLEKGVITGCLRISKESVFTGLNNLAVESMLSMNYPGAFGFTEPEVKAMMEYFDRADQYPELKKWYDGYCFGKTEIYNPWSILNYLYMGKNDPDYLPRPYWSNTSSNSIVREMVAEADDEAKEDLETLMNGGTIEKRVHEDITYGDIHQTQDNLWNFLFFTGYLKKVSERKDAAGENLCLTMKIPNTEVKTIYRESISYWFDQRMKETDRGPLLHALETGDCEAVEDFINSQLADTISYYDYAENFYHGFMAGLLVNIGGYRVKSNRESGNGRPDIVMTELKFRGRAMILELKVSETINGMEKKCEEGLDQIEKGNYAQPLTDDGYQPILKYAVCFFKKGCMVRKSK